MKIIGITGRSGCGKSSVSDYLIKKGYFVQDGDRVSREILEPGSPCLPRLAGLFGADILRADGTLDRRLLADRAFKTPEGTKQLTEVTFPEICERLYAAQRAEAAKGAEFFFMDGAVIVDTVLEKQCDAIILVEADFETSVRRICKRDGISAEMAARRLNAQKPVEYLRAACAYDICNNGTLAELETAVDAVLERLRKEYNETQS